VEFAERFRRALRDVPSVERFHAEAARSLAERCFGVEDRTQIEASLRTSSGGALVLRCGGRLSAEEVTKLLLAVGAGLGEFLPELGMGGALWRRLVLTHPFGGLRPTGARDFHRNPYVAFPLHTDGAYHSPPPEWVALGKVGEWAAEGGDTV